MNLKKIEKICDVFEDIGLLLSVRKYNDWYFILVWFWVIRYFMNILEVENFIKINN